MAKKSTESSKSKKNSAPKKAKAPRKTTASAKKAPSARPSRAGGSRGDVANGQSLVIVESPAKARTLEKYLGRDFKVMATVGHVVDLPKSKLGVEIEDDFKPQYVVLTGKKAILDNLKKQARKAARVYLAPDPDREGEAIAWHVREAIGNGGVEIHRAVFQEVTKNAVLRAIENPTEINENLFNAQQARRILDRLVGYKISPLLWAKVRRGLSAGRVQSVALRLIVDREREILAFLKEEYWTIEAQAEAAKPPPFELKLAKIDDAKPKLPNKEAADAIVEEVRGREFIVGDVIKREVARRPFPPFITSTLQQEASRKLRFSSRQTMRLAQKLYEGVELGDAGPTGLITYMRTDSTRFSGEAIQSMRAFIGDTYSPEYLPEAPRAYGKGKSAQDAHEAIRPTDIRLIPEKAARFLDKDSLSLYTLIWNRAIASQMADAKLESTRVEVPVGRCLFTATGSVLKFAGWITVYEESKDEQGNTESDADGEQAISKDGGPRLPPLEKGDRLKIHSIDGSQHFTQPPPRFTEAGLIKELEKQGIGRPSTYASIISTIQDREYVEKEGGSFRPTDLGSTITDLLIGSFPQVLDVGFTAMMESQLDEVEEGKVDWIELLKSFYQPFAKRLEVAKEGMRNLKAETVPTEHVCEKCGSPMIIRWGRNGQFLACSGYPNCKNAKPFRMTEDGRVEIVEDEVTDRKCPNCGRAMVIKSGRRGRFLACSGYPECKTSQPLPIGVPCPRPGCTGELVERRSNKGGKVFYSCSAYPECRFLVGQLPRLEKCETCGKERHMVGQPPKQKAFGCSEPNCPYLPAYDPSKATDDDDSGKPRRRGARRDAQSGGATDDDAVAETG